MTKELSNCCKVKKMWAGKVLEVIGNPFPPELADKVIKNLAGNPYKNVTTTQDEKRDRGNVLGAGNIERAEELTGGISAEGGKKMA